MTTWVDAVDALETLGIFARVAEQGIHHATEASEYLDASRELRRALKKPVAEQADFEAMIKDAKRFERFAVAERDTGFPYLNGLVVIRLWSILETLVDDVAIAYMKEPQNWTASEQIMAIKGPLVEFRNADPEEQAAYLVAN